MNQPLVAQILNLLYRRFLIGSASDTPQVANLRYGVARPSRNQSRTALPACLGGGEVGKGEIALPENLRSLRRFPLILIDCKSALRVHGPNARFRNRGASYEPTPLPLPGGERPTRAFKRAPLLGGAGVGSWAECRSFRNTRLPMSQHVVTPVLNPLRDSLASRRWASALLSVACLFAIHSQAEGPSVSYIFPAGGQRGAEVHFKVGGHYLHGEASFEMLGSGISASSKIRETNTVWFEGPIIPLPASQNVEDYPKDHAGRAKIAGDAELGVRYWRVWTSQGATPARPFVIGGLPEMIEPEIDGNPIPVEVQLPVTINGRIFPREDVDVWTFAARAGQEISCDVWAKRLGSPLEARLELRDTKGRHLAEAMATSGADPRLSLRIPEDGAYQIWIHDLSFGGLQHYVYRLTLTTGPFVQSIFPLGGRRGGKLEIQLAGTSLPASHATLDLPKNAPNPLVTQLKFGGVASNPITLEVDDLAENSMSASSQAVALALEAPELPGVFNGRIASPRAEEFWPVQLWKDQTYEFDLKASRLGSPLDSVLTVLDAAGKSLAQNDDIGGEQTDSRLTFKAPADGKYFLHVKERFGTRGGPQFSYRLCATLQPGPDFQLKLATDAVTVVRDVAGLSDEEKKSRPQPKPAQLRIDAERLGGFTGEIELSVEGIPQSVTVKGNKIAEKQGKTDLSFAAAPEAKIGATHVRIRGTAKINSNIVERVALLAVPRGQPSLDNVLLAVAMPTPFKIRGEYLFAYGLRGSVYPRRYFLDRNGFSGPLSVRLADRQVRHLQGVHGPEIGVPSDATTVEYPLTMPPWMQIGRTSRSAVMVSGVIKDRDGSEHVVSYSSGEQNDQIIAVVMEALMSIDIDRQSLSAGPNSEAEVRVRIQRDKSVAGETVKVELATPSHFREVGAEPVTITAGGTNAVLRIKFGNHPGPFNMPVLVRASTVGPKKPHTAEATLELVARPGGNDGIAR